MFKGHIYHASAQVKKRGVLIGISKRLNWNGTIEFDDKNGQILLLKGQLEGMTWTIVGIYAL